MSFVTDLPFDAFREYLMLNLGWSPLTGFPAVTETVRHVDIVADGVHKSWFIPVGNWAIDDPSMVALQWDPWPNTGVFTTLPFNDPSPLGWKLIKRANDGSTTFLSSVADMCTGFELNNISGSGNILRFVWKERFLTVDPPHPRAVFLDGAGAPSFPLNSKWAYSYPASQPNGFMVADPGVGLAAVMEVWRWRYKPGAQRNVSAMPNPQQPEGWGQRFLPWSRGPFSTGSNFIARHTDLFANAAAPGSGRRERKFKVCYYVPSIFARSALSVETVRSNFTAAGDRMGQPAVPGSRFTRGRIFWIDR
jgi:hypothetical protein